MKIYKFGGASVKDADGVRNVSSIIQNHKGNELLIVISAMGKITNKLEELTSAYINGQEDVHQIFEEVKLYHFNLLNQLFSNHDHPIFNDIINTFVEIDWLIEEEPEDAPDYIYDQIVSIGEIVSTKIVAAYLGTLQNNIKWVDARNFIHTDNTYKRALPPF
jgi:aspartate kinase